MAFGPIFQMQVFGTLCPCLEKSENKSARQAVSAINAACKRVTWHRSSSSNSSKIGGFLGGFFGKSQQREADTSGTCLAKLTVRDSGGDGQPELFVDPILNTDVEGGEQQTGYKLNIKLRRVDKVSLDDTGAGEIVLTAKPVATRSGQQQQQQQQQPGKELLRFTVLQAATAAVVSGDLEATAEPLPPATQDTRNMLAHHFMVLAEWERQRRAALKASDPDNYEDSDSDDEDQPNFLAARAQKAAHYAKRELEMKQTKRVREERKAQLIAQTGGLKYTAIAMANMQS